MLIFTFCVDSASLFTEWVINKTKTIYFYYEHWTLNCYYEKYEGSFFSWIFFFFFFFQRSSSLNLQLFPSDCLLVCQSVISFYFKIYLFTIYYNYLFFCYLCTNDKFILVLNICLQRFNRSLIRTEEDL